MNHYQKQINAYKQELLTKTGIRDVQGLVQSAQSVSKELENIYDQGNSFIDDYIRTRKPPCLSKPDHYWPIIR